MQQESEEVKALARGVVSWIDAHNLAVKDLKFVMAEFSAKRAKLKEQADKPIKKAAKKARSATGHGVLVLWSGGGTFHN